MDTNQKEPRKLLPPKNLRKTTPRCCGLCRFGFLHGEFICCLRLPKDDNKIADQDDYYTMVCDRYEK